MKKNDLINKIKDIDALTNDEKTALIELLSSQKRYGLVWEDKPEAMEDELRHKLPILKEVIDKRIIVDSNLTIEENNTNNEKSTLFGNDNENLNTLTTPNTATAPNHILIEGDNLHALSVLNYTHAGKIDVIYIDPPYNTGNKDFKYNDRFVDKEDSYRHSKWLAFMNKRLKLAKNLLKDTGVIFISIDDNEQAQLKLLCDEVFGEENFVNNIAIKVRDNAGESGGGEDKKLKKNIEYLLFFSKIRREYNLPKHFTEINMRNILLENQISNDEYVYKNVLTNVFGREYLTSTLDGSGNEIAIYKYNNFETKTIKSLIKEENLTEIEIYKKYYNKIFTTYNARTSIRDRVKASIGDFNGLIEIEYIPKSGKYKNILTKKYFSGNTMRLWAWMNEISYKKVNDEIVIKSPLGTLWEDLSWASLSSEGGVKFENGKKPIALLNRVIKNCESKNAIILDFFAGSGTTLHATMQLNAEDGGNRQCILVTNNENNIAEEVCYERNKRVINGYTKPNGDKVAGLKNNNLRYYKTEFVDSAKTIKNRLNLMELSKDMLCIKDDCYVEIDLGNIDLGNTDLGVVNSEVIDSNQRTKSKIQLFENDNIYMMIIYDEEEIDNAIEIIKPLNKKVNIYIFSPGQYPFTDDFEEVIDKVELCALPEAIYRAYKSILPKKKSIVEIEIEDSNGIENLGDNIDNE